MRTIGDLFKNKEGATKKNHKTPLLDEQTVFYVFKKVFKELYGSRGEENIEPLRVVDKKLYLRPRTSLWANEILLQKKSLIQKVNEMLEQEYLEEIILTQRSQESFKS